MNVSEFRIGDRVRMKSKVLRKDSFSPEVGIIVSIGYMHYPDVVRVRFGPHIEDGWDLWKMCNLEKA